MRWTSASTAGTAPTWAAKRLRKSFGLIAHGTLEAAHPLQVFRSVGAREGLPHHAERQDHG